MTADTLTPSLADYRESLQAAIASLEIARALEAGEI